MREDHAHPIRSRDLWERSNPMSEDELQGGIADALTLSGWRWMHIRRSDRVTMGMVGFPDIIATHPDRAVALAWELKAQAGLATPEQVAWVKALDGRIIDSRIIRPEDYDAALDAILRRKVR